MSKPKNPGKPEDRVGYDVSRSSPGDQISRNTAVDRYTYGAIRRGSIKGTRVA